MIGCHFDYERSARIIELADSGRLYKTGGVAALAIAFIYIVAGAITGIGYRVSPVPNEVSGWFALFQSVPLLGFVYLGVQDAMIAILSVPLFPALYQVQKDSSRTWALLADPRLGFGMALMWAAALTHSALMVRGRVFGRVTAVAGIAGFFLLLLLRATPAPSHSPARKPRSPRCPSPGEGCSPWPGTSWLA